MDSAVAVALIVNGLPVVTALAGMAYKLVESRLGQDKMGEVQRVASMAVDAVEKVYSSLPGSPADKKAAAMKMAQAALGKLGVSMPDEVVSMAIEAAVGALPPASEGLSQPVPGPELEPGQ